MKKFYNSGLKSLVCAALLVSASSVNAQILYDNGPYFNSVGTGFAGANESMLYTTTFGMGTIGFGHQQTSFNRVADDFTTTDCLWQIDSIVFFGYQTGSTTTSTFTGVTFRVWDSVPDGVGSSVVYGDTTTNRLSRTVWSGAYRITETTVGNSTRPIMRNVCATPGLTLQAGTFWIDWASSGSLGSGPWAPSRVPVNQNITGNGRQRIGSTWNNALDGGTGTPAQGFPFIIYGTIIQPVANAGIDLLTCQGVSMMIGNIPSATGGTGPYTYSWSPGGTLDNPANANPLATPPVSTMYTLTVTDQLGCTSIDSVLLTIVPNSSSTITPVTCGSYLSPQGNTYTSSGTYTDHLTNYVGCDSAITINLTVNSPSSASISPVACNMYTAPSGAVFMTSGSYVDIIPNMAGCDSTITINLTVNGETTSSISPTACNMYMAPSGAMFMSSGTYIDTIANMNGCDSVITIQLTVNTVDTGVSMSGVILTADAVAAVYQWVNCDSGYSIIAGASSQSFMPASDGNYAVIVTENSCTDTSACILVLGTGIDNNATSLATLYPNPATENVTVNFGAVRSEVMITITDVNGRVIAEQKQNGVQFITMDTDFAQGTYFMTITMDGQKEVKRLIIQ